MQPFDSGVSEYFRTIPIYKPEEVADIIKNFERTKDEVLKIIAQSRKAMGHVHDICKDVIDSSKPLSSIICDCEADEEENPDLDEETKHIKSVSMRNTKDKLIKHIKNLTLSEDSDSKYTTLYKLKFKTCVLISIMDDCKLADLKYQYMSARDRMLESNLRLVVCVVKKLKDKGVDFSDLIQEGNMGLIIAIDKYDYHRPTKFTTMAVNWIWLYASRAIMNKSKTIRTPIHVNNSINKLNKAIQKFINTEGRQPTTEELANLLQWPVTKVQNTKQHETQTPKIIYEDSSLDDSMQLINRIPDHSNVEEMCIDAIDNNVLKTKLMGVLSKLTPRQEKVIRLRYGLYNNNGEGLTIRNIADNEEVTTQRITQVLKSSIKKFKKYLSTDCYYRDWLDCE